MQMCNRMKISFVVSFASPMLYYEFIEATLHEFCVHVLTFNVIAWLHQWAMVYCCMDSSLVCIGCCYFIFPSNIVHYQCIWLWWKKSFLEFGVPTSKGGKSRHAIKCYQSSIHNIGCYGHKIGKSVILALRTMHGVLLLE